MVGSVLRLAILQIVSWSDSRSFRWFTHGKLSNVNLMQSDHDKTLTRTTLNRENNSIMTSPKIIHIGLWKIKKNVNPKAISSVEKQIISFKTRIPGIELAHAGPLETFDFPQEIVDAFGISPDATFLARGYNHALFIIFENKNFRILYDTSKPHLDLSAIMMPLIEGGMNGVLTVDFCLPVMQATTHYK